MMKKVASLSVLSLAIMLISVTAMAADTIKIGVPVSLTGDLAAYGIPSLNATTLVVEAQNAKGGLLGKQLEVIPQDDQCKPELATNAATRLISDNATVLVGHICSGATKAALPFYTDAKVIAISPAATTPSLTISGDFPYFFRTIVNDNAQGALSARFATEKLQAKKIAIIHDNGEYGKGYAEMNKDLLEKAGKAEVVVFEAVNPDAVDYSATVRKIKRAGVDAIIFGGYHPTAAKLINQMARERVQCAFIGPDSLKDDSLIRMAGKESEGVYASNSNDTSSLAAYAKARQQHLDKYGTEPGVFFYNAYAAAQALVNAIEKAGSLDTDKIAEALRTNSVETPAGVLRFDEHGDPTGMGLSMYQVQNGKFVETEYKIIME